MSKESLGLMAARLAEKDAKLRLDLARLRVKFLESEHERAARKVMQMDLLNRKAPAKEILEAHGIGLVGSSNVDSCHN
jgi:hypothetical protein